MKTSSVSPVVTIAIAAAVTVNVAQARTPYDGSWTVQIMTQRGACDPSSSFGVEIHDGVVSGAGGMPVHGRVSSSGAVSVSVASGTSMPAAADGCPQLWRWSWRGVGSRGAALADGRRAVGDLAGDEVDRWTRTEAAEP